VEAEEKAGEGSLHYAARRAIRRRGRENRAAPVGMTKQEEKKPREKRRSCGELERKSPPFAEKREGWGGRENRAAPVGMTKQEEKTKRKAAGRGDSPCGHNGEEGPKRGASPG